MFSKGLMVARRGKQGWASRLGRRGRSVSFFSESRSGAVRCYGRGLSCVSAGMRAKLREFLGGRGSGTPCWVVCVERESKENDKREGWVLMDCLHSWNPNSGWGGGRLSGGKAPKSLKKRRIGEKKERDLSWSSPVTFRTRGRGEGLHRGLPQFESRLKNREGLTALSSRPAPLVN